MSPDPPALLDEVLGRAERLTGDPLQQVVVLVGLHQDLVEERSVDAVRGTSPLLREIAPAVPHLPRAPLRHGSLEGG